MAKHNTIARPYARSVFEHALSGDQLEAWSSALKVLALIAKDVRVIRMWHDPKIDEAMLHDLFFQILEACVGEATKQLGVKVKNLIALLVTGKRLETLPDIEAQYHSLLIEHQNVVEVEMISAFPVDDKQKEQFCAALEKRFSSKVSIEAKEDKSLIGGVVLRSGNWVLDDSIRGKLFRLSESLA